MARPAKFRLTPDDVLDPPNARKLAGHVAEIEFFRAEVEKLQAQIAGIYDAADDDGFEKKFIRKVVAIRAKDDAVAQAEQAGIDAYTEALEIGFRSRARVENPEHDADGVIIETPAAVEGSRSTRGTDVGDGGGNQSTAARKDVQEAPPVDTTHFISAFTIGQTQPVTAASQAPAVTEAGDRSAASPSAAPVADHSKPNPICRDPDDCGTYASWHSPCETCKRAAASAA